MIMNEEIEPPGGVAGEGMHVRCFLEINGEAVGPRRPRYWVPAQEAVDPGFVQDWSGWRNVGAVTDEVPAAFRRGAGS